MPASVLASRGIGRYCTGDNVMPSVKIISRHIN